MSIKKLNTQSRIEQELELRYTFAYMEADLERLRTEARESLFTYEDILAMEITTLKLRRTNGTHKSI